MRDFYEEEIIGKSTGVKDYYEEEITKKSTPQDFYSEEIEGSRALPTPIPKPSFIKEVAKAPLRGIEQSLAGLGAMTQWIGETSGQFRHPLWNDKMKSINDRVSKKIADWGGYAADWWQEQSMKGMEAPDPTVFAGTFMQNPSWTRAVATIAGAIPSLATATVVSIATGNPVIGAASLGLPEGAFQYREARQSGKSVALSSALGGLSTVGNTLLEVIPLTRFMRGGSKTLVKDIFIGGVQEGSEEVLQALWTNTIAKLGYDKTRQLTEGMVEGFIAGAGSGGIMGGLTSGRGIQLDKVIDDAMKSGVTPQEIEVMQDAVKNQIISKADDIDDVLELAAKTELGKKLQEQMRAKEEVPLHPVEAGREALREIYPEEVPTVTEPIAEETVSKIVSKYPQRIVDQKSLEEVGNAIAGEMGIIHPITWRYHKSSKMGHGATIQVPRGLGRIYINLSVGPSGTRESLAKAAIARGVEPEKAWKGSGKYPVAEWSSSQGSIKGTIVHEFIHALPEFRALSSRAQHPQSFYDRLAEERAMRLFDVVVRPIREECAIMREAGDAPAQPSQPLPPAELPGDIIMEVIDKPPVLPTPSKGVDVGEPVKDVNEPRLSSKQRAAIHIIKKRDGISDADYRTIVSETTGGRTDSVKDISYSEALLIIRRLSGKVGPPSTLTTDKPIGPERDIYLWEQLAGPRNVIPRVWQPFSSAHDTFIREAEGIAAQLNELRTRPHRADMLQKYSDGLIDINELSADEQFIAKRVDELVFDPMVKRLDIPKERIISRYFPHIFYQDKGVWQRWTTRLDNQQKQLVADYLDGSLSKKSYAMINQSGWQAIKEIANTLTIPDEMLRLVPKELWWRHLQPRLYNTKGYRTDYWGVVRSYLYGGLRKYHMDTALDETRRYIAALPERKKSYAVRWTQKVMGQKGVVQKAFNDMLNNSYARFGNKASLLRILEPSRLSMDLSFMYYIRMLGFAIDSSVRNLSQTLLTTLPTVGPKNLAIGYLQLLTKEGRHTIHEDAVMREYEKLIQEYVRPLVGKESLDKVLNLTSSILMTPFKMAEYVNRGASYLAAIEYQRRGGALPTKSLQAAFDISNQSVSNFAKLIELHTQYEYGTFGNSPYLQNPIYRGLFPFTSFPLKTIEFWSYQLYGRHDTKWNQTAWRGVKMLVTAGICHYVFGQIIPKYRQLREGLLGISPPIQEMDMLVRALTGDKSEMDKFRNHFSRTFPLRYADKMQRVFDASERGWLVYDDEGNLMYKSNAIEQIAWLLGVETPTSNERRQMGQQIYEERLSRTDAYNRVYRLMHQNKMEEAKKVILQNKLDIRHILDEFMHRRLEPKQMRQIRRFYPEAEARFLREYFEKDLQGGQ